MLATVPSVTAYWFNSFELLMIGRLMYGVTCGVANGLAAQYLNEISEKRNRGFIGTLSGLFIGLGFFLASVAGIPAVLGTPDKWPFIFIIQQSINVTFIDLME